MYDQLIRHTATYYSYHLSGNVVRALGVCDSLQRLLDVGGQRPAQCDANLRSVDGSYGRGDSKSTYVSE